MDRGSTYTAFMFISYTRPVALFLSLGYGLNLRRKEEEEEEKKRKKESGLLHNLIQSAQDTLTLLHQLLSRLACFRIPFRLDSV